MESAPLSLVFCWREEFLQIFNRLLLTFGETNSKSIFSQPQPTAMGLCVLSCILLASFAAGEEEEEPNFVTVLDRASFQPFLDGGWAFVNFCVPAHIEQGCADIEGAFMHVAQHFKDMGTMNVGFVDCMEVVCPVALKSR